MYSFILLKRNFVWKKTLFAEAIRVFFHYCYEHTAMLGIFASITKILEAVFNGWINVIF